MSQRVVTDNRQIRMARNPYAALAIGFAFSATRAIALYAGARKGGTGACWHFSAVDFEMLGADRPAQHNRQQL